jgi:hypothetical protein
MGNIKFDFTTDFQYDLLRYTVIDVNGSKALELYSDTHFTLLEHSFIAAALKTYYKKTHRVPGKIALLEEVKDMLRSKQYLSMLTSDDHRTILDMTREIFGGIVKDGDTLLEKVEKFVQYVDLRDVIENCDLQDFSQHEALVKAAAKAITPRLKALEEKGSFLIADVKERQFKRQDNPSVIPTPFRQINALTNAGGYAKCSTIVIVDKAKKFKTGMLANIGRNYIKRKMNVLIADIENGEDELLVRLEQSLIKKTKKEILSGEYDLQVQKALRKYKRLGAEMVVKRFPAYSTTCNDIENYIDYLYREFGIRIQVLIIDYPALMGSISKTDDDTKRISDVYIDLANLNLSKKLIHTYTAMHVKGAAEKREKSRYFEGDIAKCLDIARHVQAIFGLNRTPEEEEQGFMRMEIVAQRDGFSNGRAVFQVDYSTQRAEELTIQQRNEYDKIYEHLSMEDDNELKEKMQRKGGDL